MRRGDAIALLESLDSQGTGAPDEQRRSLRDQARRLNTAMQQNIKDADAQRSHLSHRHELLSQMLQNQRTEERASRRLLQISTDQAQRGDGLFKAGHLPAAGVEEMRARIAEHRRSLASSERGLLLLKSEQLEIDREAELIEERMTQRTSTLEAQLGHNERELYRLRLNQQQHLYAPIDGRITGVLGHVGMTLEPRQPVVSMIALQADFRAELWALSHAAGALQQGQRVNLMLDAFPHARYGMLPGIITHINSSPLTLPELGRSMGR